RHVARDHTEARAAQRHLERPGRPLGRAPFAVQQHDARLGVSSYRDHRCRDHREQAQDAHAGIVRQPRRARQAPPARKRTSLQLADSTAIIGGISCLFFTRRGRWRRPIRIVVQSRQRTESPTPFPEIVMPLIRLLAVAAALGLMSSAALAADPEKKPAPKPAPSKVVTPPPQKANPPPPTRYVPDVPDTPTNYRNPRTSG